MSMLYSLYYKREGGNMEYRFAFIKQLEIYSVRYQNKCSNSQQT
jgi:hypothetical protein